MDGNYYFHYIFVPHIFRTHLPNKATPPSIPHYY